MERLDSEVRRELGRFGPIEGDTAAIVRAWPHAVGATVARNAWPARIARDGTLLVHTVLLDLGVRARPPRRDDPLAASRASSARVRRARSSSQPDRCPKRPVDAPAGRSEQPPESSPERRAEAAEIAAAIEDDELRRLVARAAAASLSRADRRPPDDRRF